MHILILLPACKHRPRKKHRGVELGLQALKTSALNRIDCLALDFSHSSRGGVPVMIGPTAELDLMAKIIYYYTSI